MLELRACEIEPVCERGIIGGGDVDVTDFAELTSAWFFVVEVQVCAGNREHLRVCGDGAQQVEHCGLDERVRFIGMLLRHERPPHDGANVEFKLRNLGAVLCPMAGVVDAGGHLVGEESAIGKLEQLDREHTDIAGVFEQAAGDGLGALLKLGRERWRGRDGFAKHTFAMGVLGERVKVQLTGCRARGDDGEFACELDERFKDQLGSIARRGCGNSLPGRGDVGLDADDGLTLAIVTHASCFEDCRQTERGRGGCELFKVGDGCEIGCSDAAKTEELLFEEAVLRDGENICRRKDRECVGAGGLVKPAECFGGNVLELVSDEREALRKAGERIAIGVLGDDNLADIRGGAVGGWLKESKLKAERKAGKGKHAAELAAAEDPDDRTFVHR